MLKAHEHHLLRSLPEQQGISSAAILTFVEALERDVQDVHSFMLLRHGQVVAEGWWSPYERESPHMLYSLSKSFTSTAVGMAVAEGYFSIDDLVLPFFPDEAPDGVNDFLRTMRVRHLLSMTTGHDEDTWWHMTHRADGNWIKAFFGVPIVHEPGTHFLYNTGATYMLSAIVQKTTGMKVVDFLEARLFERLGIKGAKWEDSPQGINLGGIGLYLKTEDVARFGQLYLQKGMWQGEQVISEAWVEAATALQVSNGEGDYSDWTQGYGYQFWRCRHGAYRGDGAFGQYCVVMPEQDAVLAITGGMALEDMQQPLDLLWNVLLPAMHDGATADNAGEQARLAEKLTQLALPVVVGDAVSPYAARVSGRTYRLQTNELQLDTLSLRFSESGCQLAYTTARGQAVIACGNGVWSPGQTDLFDMPTAEVTAVAASGAWMGEDSYKIVMRLCETPYYYTLVFYFADDELMIEIGVNLSFEAQQTLLVTGAALV